MNGKYKYKVLTVVFKTENETEEFLNNMGEEGWEIVCLTNEHDLCFKIVFKKSKE